MSAWGPFTFTLVHESTGPGGAVLTLPGRIRGPGRLTGVQVRRDVADTVTTSVTPAWVSGAADVESSPPDERIVARAALTALTASATVASIDEDIDLPRSFSELRMGGTLIFSGAGTSTTHWTVWGDKG